MLPLPYDAIGHIDTTGAHGSLAQVLDAYLAFLTSLSTDEARTVVPSCLKVFFQLEGAEDSSPHPSPPAKPLRGFYLGHYSF